MWLFHLTKYFSFSVGRLIFFLLLETPVYQLPCTSAQWTLFFMTFILKKANLYNCSNNANRAYVAKHMSLS